MYQNYIFDLYGTLVDIRTDEEKLSFWEEITDLCLNYGATYDALSLKDKYKRLVKEEYDKVKNENPTYSYLDINLLNVFSKISRDQNIILDETQLKEFAHDFRTASTDFIFLYDGVLDLLNTLKDKNKKIYLLSNAQSSFTVPELELLDIYKYFDGILISSDVNCSKPDYNFFSILFERYNLKKDESIMIGNDAYSDIDGANNFGIDSLYIHQEISSDITNKKLLSKYTILDGDVFKIKDYVIK